MNTGRSMLEGMPGSLQDALRNDDSVGRRLVWEISAISVYLMRIADLLGRPIDVSGSQWITMMAIDGLGGPEGVSVRDVAVMLNVDGSFVSAQSRTLEKQGLVRRVQSSEDKRLVLLSLTPLAVQRLKDIESSRQSLEQHVCGELDDVILGDLSRSLIEMRRRLNRAMLLVAAGGE